MGPVAAGRKRAERVHGCSVESAARDPCSLAALTATCTRRRRPALSGSGFCAARCWAGPGQRAVGEAEFRRFYARWRVHTPRPELASTRPAPRPEPRDARHPAQHPRRVAAHYGRTIAGAGRATNTTVRPRRGNTRDGPLRPVLVRCSSGARTVLVWARSFGRTSRMLAIGDTARDSLVRPSRRAHLRCRWCLATTMRPRRTVQSA